MASGIIRAALRPAANLSDVQSLATTQSNLGLGSAAFVADSALLHIAGTEVASGAKKFPSATGIRNADPTFYMEKANATRLGYWSITDAGAMVLENEVAAGTMSLRAVTSLSVLINGTEVAQASYASSKRQLLMNGYGSLKMSTGNAYGRVTGMNGFASGGHDDYFLSDNWDPTTNGIDNAALGTVAIRLQGSNPGSGNVGFYTGTTNTVPTRRAYVDNNGIFQNDKAVIAHAGAYTSGLYYASTSAPSGGSDGDTWDTYI